MPDPVDDLYGLPPAEFVAARNRLVKDLRRAGERDRAGEVAGLRRPSPAAWAVNQVARRHRDRLEALIEAGADLRAAQAGALAGDDPRALRQAGRARRDAVADVADLAVGLLAGIGVKGETHREAVAATLDAASLAAAAAEAVAAGRLEEGLTPHSGFGGADTEAAAVGADGRDRAGGGEAESAAAERSRRAEREAARRRVEAERAAERSQAARRRLADAEDAVEAAGRALDAARRRARRAAEDLAEADRAAEEALRDAAGPAEGADG